ncbi:MAG: tetratricopeptide repeat protein, partial [Cyclobacteriaceae bacterium]|nr:tetratricopeptide repeat protein [Cyclobacteriaceae bacterium HetDA_MAG_MS6]
GIHKSYLNLGVHFTLLPQYDSGYFYLRKAEQYYGSDPKFKPDQYALCLYYLGLLYDNSTDYERSATYYNKALEAYRKIGDSQHEAYALNALAGLKMHESSYVEALDFYHRAYEIKYTLGLPSAIQLNNIAVAYKRMMELEKAFEFGQKSLDDAIYYEDSVSISRVLNTIGDVFLLQGIFDSSFVYYQQSLAIAKEVGHSSLMTAATHELARFHEHQGETEEAKNIYKKLLASDHLSQYQRERLQLSLAETYQKNKEYHDAIKTAAQGIRSAIDNRHHMTVKQLAELLKDTYQLHGDASKAQYFATLASTYSDSLKAKNQASQFANMRIKLETLEQEKTIEALQQQAQIDALIRSRLLIVIIAIAAVSILIMIYLQTRRRYENRIQGIKNESLQQEVERRKDELHRQTVHMIHLNNTLNEVEEQLKKIGKDGGYLDTKRIFQKININKQLEKNWENFNYYFGSVNQDFFQRLLDKNSKLTQHEQRICALVKMNMTNHEIATLLNIEAQSAKMAKYRVKKKLDLCEEVDLGQYLQVL